MLRKIHLASFVVRRFSSSTHRIEELNEGFSSRYTWDGKNWNEKKIPKFQDMAYVDRISIYADIILKSFYCSAKVQLSKSLLCDVERGRGRNLCGATELKGSLSLFYVHKINLILFVLLLLHHANIKFIFRERSDIWKLPPRNRAYMTGPRFLLSPLFVSTRKIH